MRKFIKKPVATYVPLLVATALVVTAAPADAAPNKIGPVKGLSVTVTKPDGPYVVASDWDDLTGATSYRVSLTVAGTVLASDKVTASDWSATTTRTAGTEVTVKVTPLVGKKPGKQTSLPATLPDLTPPTGTFQLVQDSPGAGHVIIQQVSLSDDLTPAGDINRTINWGDGTVVPWSGGDSVDHTYAPEALNGTAYEPSVTLTDGAGNPWVVQLDTVVVGDTEKPSGAFGATASGWARWSKIALTETTPAADNFSSRAEITGTVEWGDGTTDTWTSDSAPTHVYAVAATYTPTVTLTDQAGNEQQIDANAVVVTADTSRPTVSVRKPAKRRTWVRKWATLHGKASDAGTGVKVVKLRVIEKRGTTWYAYRTRSHRWVRGGTTQAAAVRRATLAKVKPNAMSTWSYQVSGLRKGRLVVQARAVDNVKNKSTLRTVSQTLTHS